MVDSSDEEKSQFDENSSERIRQLLLNYIQKVGHVFMDDKSVQKTVHHLWEKINKPFP